MASFTMNAEEQARSRNARFRDRRAFDRYEINASGGCLNFKDSKYPCAIVDVSLSGCCVRTESTFLPGNLANVEVVLPLLGMVVRMNGTTQWLTRQNLIGIHFIYSNSRAKNQLAGLLTGLVDQSVAEEVKAEMVATARMGTTALDVEIPDEWLLEPKAAAKKSAEEGMAQNRKENAWPAVLHILKDGLQQKGAIVAISLEGCTVQTTSTFFAGVYARVEVDFQMRGLPFLLLGVTEDVRDKTRVKIRFLAMSSRKREELEELLGEFREAEKNPTPSSLPMGPA